jgi:hypothetical protein
MMQVIRNRRRFHRSRLCYKKERISLKWYYLQGLPRFIGYDQMCWSDLLKMFSLAPHLLKLSEHLFEDIKTMLYSSYY